MGNNDENDNPQESGIEKAAKLLAAKQEKIYELALQIVPPGDDGNTFSEQGLFISTGDDGFVSVSLSDIFPNEVDSTLIYMPNGEPYSNKANKYRLAVPRITDPNWIKAHSDIKVGEWSTMYFFTPSGAATKLTQHPIIVSGDLSDFNLFTRRNRFRVEQSALLDGELELPGFVLDAMLTRLSGIIEARQDPSD